MDQVRTFLEDYGLWSLLVLVLVKFVTGVFVAIQKNEFKWFYLGNVFKTDFLKLATYALVVGIGRYAGVPEFNNDYVTGGTGAILAADLVAGVMKNLAHLLPTLADTVPSSFREPARLRLGNPRNLPN